MVPVTRDGHIADGSKPRLFLRTPFNETGGRSHPSPSLIGSPTNPTNPAALKFMFRHSPAARAIRISTGCGIFPAWSNASELFYVSPEPKLMVVSLQRSKVGSDALEATSPRELFALDAVNDGYSPYETSPDGKRFLLRQPSQTQPLSVVVNWSTMLK